MRFWFIDDFDEYRIYITDGWVEYYWPKFRIDMTVSEPYLTLRWNDREKGAGGAQREIIIDFRDVVDGYAGYISNPSSAADLMASIEAMIVSAWTSAVPGDSLLNKGDLLTHDGVSDVIHPAGPDRSLVGYDSANPDGLEDYTTASVVSDGLVAGDNSITKTSNSIITRSSFIIGYSGNVASTNTTLEEIFWSVLIPANTIRAGDALKITWGVDKSTGSGAATTRIRLHTSAAVGAGSIYGMTAYTGTVKQFMESNILFTGASAQVGTPATGLSYGQFGIAFSTGALSVASDMYVVITSQKVTGTDATALVFADVNVLKYRT